MKTWIASPAEYFAMTPKEQSEYRCAVDRAAQEDGAVVERWFRADESWSTTTVEWDWYDYIYRIRRKPAVVWIWRHTNGGRGWLADRTEAECNIRNEGISGRAVCFVEKEPQ